MNGGIDGGTDGGSAGGIDGGWQLATRFEEPAKRKAAMPVWSEEPTTPERSRKWKLDVLAK